MTKYLLTIWICALLVVGLNETARNDLQESPETAEILADVVSSSVEKEAFDFAAITSSHTYDGILIDLSFRSHTPPSKTLKHSVQNFFARTLTSAQSRLSDYRWRNLPSGTPHLKYSTRYYLYTLDRLLI